jgi:uncharacterized protein (TIGR04255 family)
MSNSTVFPNAPITEALIDIRAQLPAEVTVASLGAFHDAIQQRYPNRQELTGWEAGFQIGGGTAAVAQASAQPVGAIYGSANGTKAVQARLNGFTFNRLKPYESWEPFRNEAIELWQHYCAIARPVSVTRLALRYINRIEIPLPLGEFKEYVLTVPEIAPGLPQGLQQFLMRLEIPYPNDDVLAIVTETMESVKETSKVLPFILDIDVFREVVLDPGSNETWSILETLRVIKNDIFFKSVTEKTKELFR